LIPRLQASIASIDFTAAPPDAVLSNIFAVSGK
jgi:hypothetical protein